MDAVERDMLQLAIQRSISSANQEEEIRRRDRQRREHEAQRRMLESFAAGLTFDERQQVDRRQPVRFPVAGGSLHLVKLLAKQFQNETGLRVRVYELTRALAVELDGVASKMSTEGITARVRSIKTWISDPAAMQRKLTNLANESVHIYVDNSNLVRGCKIVQDANGNRIRDPTIRVNFEELARAMQGERNVCDRVVAGSSASQHDLMWMKWKEQGFTTHVQELMPGQRESFVDEALMLQFIHKAINTHSTNQRRHTLALLTGDGNLNGGRCVFCKMPFVCVCVCVCVCVWCFVLFVRVCTCLYVSTPRELMYVNSSKVCVC